MTGREQLPHSVERMKRALGLWLEDRRFTELLLRCRYDDSPLGECARDVVSRSRARLAEDLLEVAVNAGISTRYLREIELMAALITASFTDALELIIAGTVRDVDAMATALARAHYHHVRGELTRMGREQAGNTAAALARRR